MFDAFIEVVLNFPYTPCFVEQVEKNMHKLTVLAGLLPFLIV